MSGIDYDAVNKMNVGIIEEFRANGGQLSGGFAGRPMILLTIKGRKSGQERTTPLVYLPVSGANGDRVFVFASKGGAPDDPDWYKNLVANPDVTVEIGDEKYAARAVVITGPERDELFARQMAEAEQFRTYQTNTTRVIPVVELVRA
jgi:deazaflavin-dependent oxidoreductase (nitroreductase family)